MRYFFIFSDFVQPLFFGGKYNFSSSVNKQKQIISTTFALLSSFFNRGYHWGIVPVCHCHVIFFLNHTIYTSNLNYKVVPWLIKSLIDQELYRQIWKAGSVTVALLTICPNMSIRVGLGVQQDVSYNSCNLSRNLSETKLILRICD